MTWTTVNDLVARENVALSYVVVHGYLTVIFLLHIRSRFPHGRRGTEPMGCGALALARSAYAGHHRARFMTGGDTVYRVWVWTILKVFNDGSNDAWVKHQWPVAIFASVAVVIGGLCTIRVFAKEGYRHQAWVSRLLVLIAVLTINANI